MFCFVFGAMEQWARNPVRIGNIYLQSGAFTVAAIADIALFLLAFFVKFDGLKGHTGA